MSKPRKSFIVDFVARGTASNEWRMVLVEQGPWKGDITAKLRGLQARLYECIDAALDGQLAERFPESHGKRIVIQVDGYALPEDEVSAFFARFSQGALESVDYKSALEERRFIDSIGFELNLSKRPSG